jgi:hypothetical protein
MPNPTPGFPSLTLQSLERLIFLVIMAGTASAATLNLTPTQDATLYEDSTGSVANGAGEYLLIGRTNQASNSRRRGLLQFDITSLPAGALVTSATLQMHLELVNTANVNVSLYPATTAWTSGPADPLGNESTGVAAVLGDTTWLHASMPSVWATPGGDFRNTPSATMLVTTTVGYFQWTGSGLVADVLQWQANPAANFGWLLAADETTGQTAKRFESANSSTVAFRPMLTLEYTAVPEPGSNLLVLMVIIAVAGRKSRCRVGNESP